MVSTIMTRGAEILLACCHGVLINIGTNVLKTMSSSNPCMVSVMFLFNMLRISLCYWVSDQRKHHRKSVMYEDSTLKSEMIKALFSVGFAFGQLAKS